MSVPPATPPGAVRVVICDYNALLLSVTGLLRMSGFYVFQAYDGVAAAELCRELPRIDLLVLNTEGTGVDTPELVRSIRDIRPGLPVLHIGKTPIPGMPSDVVNLEESFDAAELLLVVNRLLPRRDAPGEEQNPGTVDDSRARADQLQSGAAAAHGRGLELRQVARDAQSRAEEVEISSRKQQVGLAAARAADVEAE